MQGKIESLGKFNLNTGLWGEVNSHYELGRCFAMGDYEPIINNEKEGIHYIILAHGSRVEDHSKDFITIPGKEISVDDAYSYFSRKNRNYKILSYLMDADAPIKEDAKALAQYIGSLASNTHIKSINLVGLSKCGAMSFYVPSYFGKKDTFDKTNIYTIATPFLGTRMAAPELIFADIERMLVSKFGDNRFTKALCEEIKKCYKGISSNSHMDFDIAIPSGFPDGENEVYDPSFIRDMFSRENIESIGKVGSYKNFVTGIDDNTLTEAIKTGNFTGIGLCVLGKLFFDEPSDGMVPVSSQEIVTTHIEGLRNEKLVSAHHDVFGNKRVFNEVLDSVNSTIEEQVEIGHQKRIGTI